MSVLAREKAWACHSSTPLGEGLATVNPHFLRRFGVWSGSGSTVSISAQQVQDQSSSSLQPWFALDPKELLQASGSLTLAFDWPRSAEDPRELSEINELRLWSLRADALCPWLPLLLERSSGQLTRHVAMLLPHQFSRTEGFALLQTAWSSG